MSEAPSDPAVISRDHAIVHFFALLAGVEEIGAMAGLLVSGIGLFLHADAIVLGFYDAGMNTGKICTWHQGKSAGFAAVPGGQDALQSSVSSTLKNLGYSQTKRLSLVHLGRTVGSLAIARRDPARLTPEEEFLVTTLQGLTALLLANREQSERLKAALDALRESEESFRVTLNSIGDAVIATDISGRITFLNPVASVLTGWLPTEARGQPIENVFRIINEKSRVKGEDIVTRVLQEGHVFQLANDTALIARDGREIPIADSAAPIRDATGKVVGAVLVFLDVTEKRRAQKALQESEERFRLMVDGVKEYAIFMLDPHGYVTTWNAGAQRLKGYTAKQIVGQHFSLFFTPEDIAMGKPERELRFAAEHGQYAEECWRVRQDGSRFLGNVTVTAAHDADGRLRGFAKVTQDITERKQVEKELNKYRYNLEQVVQERTIELKEATAYNRRLLEASLDPLVTIGRDGKITDVNLATEVATGRGRNALVGTDFCDYFTEPEKARSGYQQVFSEGSVQDYPLELRHVDGGVMSVLYNASVYRSETGEVVGVFAAARDITKRKRAEAARNAERQRFLDVLETLPVILTLLRPDHRVEWVNRAYRRVLGDNVGQLCYESQFGYDEPCPECQAFTPLQTGQPHNWECIAPTGQTFDVYNFPFADADGSPLILEMDIDITERRRTEAELGRYRRRLEELVKERTKQLEATNAQLRAEIAERKQAENKLRESESEQRRQREFLERLIAHAGTCIAVVKGHELRYTLANPAFQVFAGELPMVGRTYCEVFPEAAKAGGEARVQRVLETGEPWKVENYCAPAPGVPDATWEGHVVRLPAIDGDEPSALVVIWDITERKRAAEALLRSEKLASVGRMAASIAHEINNPLEAVVNTIYLALTNADKPDSVRQYLHVAEEELRRVSHITRQTLGFYRETSVPTTVSVGAILDSAVNLLSAKIKLKCVSVQKEYDDTLQVVAVSGELRQVFSNLLANSLDAIDREGAIKLRVSRSRGKDGRPRVRITVADNGKGIDAATLPRIFEALFTTKKETGSGLGLWVSEQLIDKHQGAIRVRTRTSGERRGTAFSIFMPMNVEQAAPARAGTLNGGIARSATDFTPKGT